MWIWPNLPFANVKPFGIETVNPISEYVWQSEWDGVTDISLHISFGKFWDAVGTLNRKLVSSAALDYFSVSREICRREGAWLTGALEQYAVSEYA